MKEKKHVRIIDSTYTIGNGKSEAEAMIGGMFEVGVIDYEDGRFMVYTDKEKKDFWHFNFSDVQEVCIEAVVDGYVLGVGDLLCDRPILRFHIHSGEVKVRGGTEKCTYTFDLSDVERNEITPLYNPTAETIKIGEKLYNKSEVDTALANLKEIK